MINFAVETHKVTEREGKIVGGNVVTMRVLIPNNNTYKHIKNRPYIYLGIKAYNHIDLFFLVRFCFVFRCSDVKSEAFV